MLSIRPGQPAAIEFNFDGLVGPSHHYAGLSYGNLASSQNIGSVANPKQAALQGLDKMRMLATRGLKQAVLPPQARPNFRLLRQLGFSGSDAHVLACAHRSSPALLSCAYSASSMWTANMATVSPSADTMDGRVHFTPANLNNKLHRAQEHVQATQTLRALFRDERYFAVHDALPSTPALSDEGAANHTRLCANHGAAGVEIFVYGRSEFNAQAKTPTQFPARQTLEASQAIARLHGLHEKRTLYIQQNPAVIELGVFHNDVIAVGHQNVLFYHEDAFVDESTAITNLQRMMNQMGAPLHALRVNNTQVSVRDAVGSYLFNSQLLSLPKHKENGKMALLVPHECQENPRVAAYLAGLIASDGPIDELISVDLRQSMRNGGGPACLRLRIVLSDEEAAAMHQGVVMTETLYATLIAWVEKHYRDRLSQEDLADPLLAIEIQTALEELAKILDLPGLYEHAYV